MNDELSNALDEMRKRAEHSSSRLDDMFWILDDNGNAQPAEMMKMAEWKRTHDNGIIAKTYFTKDDSDKKIEVSTVFLGINRNWSGGDPVLFETMIFGGPEEIQDFQQRYHTLAEARAGHQAVVMAIQWPFSPLTEPKQIEHH